MDFYLGDLSRYAYDGGAARHQETQELARKSTPAFDTSAEKQTTIPEETEATESEGLTKASSALADRWEISFLALLSFHCSSLSSPRP